ncbi:MAG: sulfatase [Planctomycetaceae bacterium]|nr:sulfatase [Planctomycetaceae bacterium]
MTMQAPQGFGRRQLLSRTSTGFGLAAFAGLLAKENLTQASDSSFGPRAPHFEPKAKHVIFCYMSGGMSQCDTFDHKPRLKAEAGKPIPFKTERTQFNNKGTLMPTHWEFKKRGESGLEISELFPHLATCADDLAIVKSMTAEFSEHAQGNYFMHTGFPFRGHPSAGAWMTYGLGSENENLPGFVVLNSGGSVPPHGGVGLFSNGYLPAIHQASSITLDKDPPVSNIVPKEADRRQRKRLNFISNLDSGFLQNTANDTDVESAIRNYEMAYKMQAAVPDVVDLSTESAATFEMYGVNDPDVKKGHYARQCILARRLIEKGVRFIELSCLQSGVGGGGAANPWDNHGGIKVGHGRMGNQVDQPIAALIKDLKQRDLLKDTLIVFAGEFGRTPFAQGSDGRDHDPYGFSIFMAGGGIKGGVEYGRTDEYGYHVVENKTTVWDMWATALHLMGINHMDLTYRFGGRDMRLTDVHGNVLHDIIT